MEVLNSPPAHQEYIMNQSTPVTNPFLPGYDESLELTDDEHIIEDSDPAKIFYYMDFEMSLGEDIDERFGFSVMGGSDEGFSPHIDEVLTGSAADRADLEVGDEIIEVNGQSLEGATHANIIEHIHQCIKSRTIKLRVKRTSQQPSTHSIGSNGEVQDAYVIAVEDEARSRLEQLSSLHKVKAVDLATVQLEGAESGESHTEAYTDGHTEDYTETMDGMEEDQENCSPHLAHREMPIDCPKGFVGIKKEPPRLPHTFLSASNSPRGTPTKRRALDNQTNLLAPATSSDGSISDQQQIERIKKYQDDLRKRKEEEERIQREQDFLRTSLRGSKKLQELEESKRMHPGIDNPNYVLEEEDESTNKSATSSATLPVRTLNYEGLIQQPLAVDDLFASLHRIQSRLHTVEDEKALVPVQQLLQNPRFQNALYVHNKVVEVALRQPQIPPVNAEDATSLAQAVDSALPNNNKQCIELHRLLTQPHVEALLYAHDKVAVTIAEQRGPSSQRDDGEEAEREYLYERASQYGEESIKIVRINKTSDPLGATVRNEGDSVLVGRIVKGGAAEASGLLHEGDEILEINGTDIRGRTVDDVCELMAGLTGTLTFLIVPSDDIKENGARDSSVTNRLMHVRAHFDYDPEDDLYIPCRELGISFQKGDVLHVINQEDPCWWQAYRDGEEDQTLAGLIPSRSFVETRESARQTIVDEDDKKKQRCRCRCRHHKKKKKKMYSVGGEDAENEEILSYEEVVSYYPQPNRKRPIVLIGAPHVGRHELRQRLMESDPDRFAAAVPYTTRTQKDDEVDGKHYHFVPRTTFEADIHEHKFVEFGEYEKNLYGTSIEAIRTVVNSGKICVLNLHPQSLRILKNSDLKPYIVLVAPPNIEKLKEIRIQAGAKVSDSELKDTIEKAREMEDSYGHYFDFIIVNYDIDRAYDELITEINRLEVERQWVPSQWQS